MEEHYVYSHINPITNKCFYIGIGKNDRVISDGRHRNEYWRKEVYSSGGYLFKILVNGISKKKAIILETNFIKQIGLDNLTNIIGEGGNETTFKNGHIPWNKWKINAQKFAVKRVMINNIEYESINECVKCLGIGKSTFYRWVKKNKVKYL